LQYSNFMFQSCRHFSTFYIFCNWSPFAGKTTPLAHITWYPTHPHTFVKLNEVVILEKAKYLLQNNMRNPTLFSYEKSQSFFYDRKDTFLVKRGVRILNKPQNIIMVKMELFQYAYGKDVIVAI
jgi:hypothetical protein